MVTRHEKTCGVCGSFIPLAKPGDKVIVCPKCGSEWEVPPHVRREDAVLSLAGWLNTRLAD